ncbi:MAG TPA: Dyp-type peroxidase [Gallionellaceae bacterium]|nr:Dyp-type peroxidase [Gallionellaceae bacterium]
MNRYQTGIMDAVPLHARHLFFALTPDVSPARAMQALASMTDGRSTVTGLGRSLVLTLGHNIPGLTVFPQYAGVGLDIPSTPFALWCWLRGDDRGDLVHRSRQIEQALSPALNLSHTVDAFRYKTGLDLTGYEDGTENPQGADALAASFSHSRGIEGSSFVAVQQWTHDLARFEAMSVADQDNTIGRHKSDNEEIEDAPAAAHVKRTAQESFTPEAFVLRRSMPWADDKQAGLMFVAFGKSFDAYESLLRRMVGAEDGVVDALFRFTRPVSGSYFWCPPMRNGHLDLRAIGL